MRLTTAQKRYRLLRPPPVQWNDDHGRWESVRPLDAEVLVELDRFHATPVASVLEKPRAPLGEGARREEWAAYEVEFRTRYRQTCRTKGRPGPWTEAETLAHGAAMRAAWARRKAAGTARRVRP